MRFTQLYDCLLSKKQLLIFFLLMFINILYMHLTVLGDFRLGAVWWYRAVTFMFVDILATVLIINTVTLFISRRVTYCVSWFLLLALESANIVYSRFFHQYLSASAISEVSNMQNGWWMEYISTAFKASDILLLITTAIFLFIAFSRRYSGILRKPVRYRIIIVALIILIGQHSLVSDAYNIYQKDFPVSIDDYISESIGKEFNRKFTTEQEQYVCGYGLLRTQVLCNVLYYKKDMKLTDSETQQITQYIEKRKNDNNTQKTIQKFSQHKNIVIIIVESLLSTVIDKTVNGTEVTPYLNKLKRSDKTFYNGRMQSNISIGESSDGQFIYFTGLLPLTNEITVTKLLEKELISFPKLLKEQYKYNTYITIPTKPFVWHQNEANKKYGIDIMYSTIDNGEEFISDDSTVFTLAHEKEKEMKSAYLHIILTASMHSPYTNPKPELTKVKLDKDSGCSREMNNYLLACHYTDMCIEKYMESYKSEKKYDNTIFIITSDHEAHADMLNMTSNDLDGCNLPLFIVNADIENGVHNCINQIDLYPTLVDIFNLKTKWQGLGYSIIRPDTYRSTITSEQRNVSELIIRGDYFRNQTNR